MIVNEHPLKDAWRRVVWGPGREALEALPAPAELIVLDRLARAAALALSGRRAALRRNLRRAFPAADEGQLDRWARDAFAAHFANQYASFSFGKCDAATWPRYLRWEGLARLQEVHASGRGAVLMHLHMGPAQLPLHVLGRLGWRVHQIGGGRVTRVELSETGRWAAETRARLESRMPVTLHDGKRYLRPALRALEQGEIVLTAADATGGGEELGRRRLRTVLGAAMPVPVGPVWLAARSGAALMTLVCHRNPQPGPPWVAEIGPEVPLPREASKDALLDAGADAVAAFLDATLRRWPGDWLFWDGFEPGGLLPAEAS